MTLIDCLHTDAAPAGRVCCHLLANSDEDYCKRFAGTGPAFDLICLTCMKVPEALDAQLRAVCLNCFRRIETEGYWEATSGEPQVLERWSELSFTHTVARLTPPIKGQLLDIQPVEAMREPVFVALTTDREIVSLDLAAGTSTVLAHLPPSDLDLSESITLHLSPDGQLAAIANTRGEHGMVMDLLAAQITMQLLRDSYHEDVSNYPLAFFEHNGRLLLVHGTKWNRLDVSDPLSGELLTSRAFTLPDGAKYPEHYLDYFHCGLSVSPNQEWILDKGWGWHPAGLPYAWNLRQWMRENVWESEDGSTKRKLSQDYDWDLPSCWLDGTTVALARLHNFAEEKGFDGARIYDVTSGRMLRWFAGPAGKLAFDSYLFSYSDQSGTSVWDHSTGERLLWDDPLRPVCYHRGAHCFLSVFPDRAFQLSRLKPPRGE